MALGATGGDEKLDRNRPITSYYVNNAIFEHVSASQSVKTAENP